jgi:hypothetical protein
LNLNEYIAADFLGVLVARHYELQHGASVVSVGLAPKWDIQFKDGITMEIKEDIKAAETLNAAIEYWNTKRNIPTGILLTQASIWLHCVPNGQGLRCYEIETKRLLKMCFESGVVMSGGDYNSNLMKLIPLQEMKKICSNEFDLEKGSR